MIRQPNREDDRRFHPRSTSRRYVVRVGHISVTVESGSPEWAIQAARRQLETEFPRLWDVIAQLDRSRFHVEEVRKVS